MWAELDRLLGGFLGLFILLLLLGLLNVNARDESYTLFEFVEKYQCLDLFNLFVLSLLHCVFFMY